MTSEKPWVKAYPEGVNPELEPIEFLCIPELLRHSARTYGAKKAFTVCMPNGMAGSLTFQEADTLGDRFAVFLRHELKLEIGARVAVQMPNGLASVVAAFGILKAGCVLVNVNPLYTPKETAHQLADSEASVLVVADMFAADLSPAAREKLDRVVVARITEFLPPLTGAFIQGVLKYVKRKVRPPGYPHLLFAEAIRAGQRIAAAEGVVAEDLAADLTPKSAALLQYTGGTTGVSKGAILTHANIIANTVQSYQMMGKTMVPGSECGLTVLPLYHIFAFTINLIGLFQVGALNILVPSPRPIANLRRPMRDYPITWMSGVNTLFNALLNESWFRESPPKALKASISAGMPLHKAVAVRWREITGSPVVEGYGLTEASPTLTVTPFGSEVHKVETIGIPLPGTDIRLVGDAGETVDAGQPGELQARGPQVMAGYWNRPEETAEVLNDGWLATGDIAVMDGDGYFRIVDRKKDMIIVSGFKVFPNEVEDCLSHLEGVTDIAVIGVSDAATGEAVKAFAVRDDPTLTEDAVRAHCREHLTAYKVPKFVEFRDDLPKSAVGKILRKELRAETVEGK
jgi:long-chain acyl-CoA synthetase